jgi:hypothetical protein
MIPSHRIPINHDARAGATRLLDGTRVPWVVCLSLCVAAVALRLFLMMRSVGTNDVPTWQAFATSIDARGLAETYRTMSDFNHPPLAGLWAMAALRLGQVDGLGFPFTFKLLALSGDLLAAWLLFRHARPASTSGRALGLAALFLWNPVSLLVTAYHGNTDPLLASLFLLAALRAQRGDPLGAGLAWSGAMNVKVISLLLLAPLAFSSRTKRDAFLFGAGTLAASLPFLLFALTVGRPFLFNVFAYNSAPAMWGINLMLNDIVELRYGGQSWAWLKAAFLVKARHLILAGSLAGAIWRVGSPHRDCLVVCAFALCLSLVLAPGFGYQYLAWPMPLLFAIDARRALLTSLAGGVLIGLLYLHFWDGAIPATSWTSTWPRFGVVWGVIAWLSLVAWSVRLGRSILRDT